MQIRTATAWIFAGVLTICAASFGADVTLEVDVQNPSHPISPRLVGIFLEDINFGVDGGLNAELVKNGSFEFPKELMGWATLARGTSPDGRLELRDDDPAYASNPHFLRLSSGTTGSEFLAVNEGFRGMGVRAGERYQFSMMARAAGEVPTGLRILLLDENGNPLANAPISKIGSPWSERSAVLTPSKTAAKARLAIALTGPGDVDVDMVSLCPEKTWKNRPHGMRADIVQALADLKPAFFRFPGGCIVEGSELADRYQWKQTIGPLPDRRLNFNRWNTVFRHKPAPDYYQSYGVGFFEYFQLAEDIGAEPLPILNCGMACQFQSGALVPLEELQPYLQDALDLIEFANGPVTSTWGAKRAALGHPEPFNLKLLGVGNEQWGPEYFERYEIFARELEKRHPEIELVSGTGPFPADPKFEYAWPRLRELRADIVDEHCYAMPDWFRRSATRFDNYPRTGPKVFMGEYAAQSVDITSPDNRNSLRCALAEAAFLTGLERNSDVVVMSAYAPLLGHVDAWQWRPNLIWFDNLNVVRTPNYYVQQLFGRHRGDAVLPVKLADSRPPQPPRGRIGLVTDRAAAEFKDIRVEHDGQQLFAGEQLTNAEEMTTFRGRWEVDGGGVRQVHPGELARAQFGDPAWEDCTISLKARKTAGPGGFGILFRNSDGGSFLQWTLGGPDNQHRLEANQASHSEDKNVIEQVPGEIENDRWYDVKVELRGDDVRCYLDGALIHEATIPGPSLPRLYATASRDEASQELILKMVNPTDQPADVAISLNGVAAAAAPYELIVLSGDPDDENSLEQPDRVAPRSSDLKIAGPNFEHTFPPHSLSVMRIKPQ